MEKKITEKIYERLDILSLISDDVGEICVSLMSSFFQNYNYFENGPLSYIMVVIFRRQSLDSTL